MAVVLLVAAIALGLLMIPFGFPGTLVIFGAALCYYLLVPGGAIGLTTVVVMGILMVLAEGLEWVLTSRFTKRYGGSRRAGWGAILGGFVGAFLGVPVPIVGSVIGGFVGAFVGAFVAEWSRREPAGSPTRVATGALLGRAVGAAIKCAFGLAIAACLVLAAIA